MIPVRGFDGANVAVLGLGRSGLSAARALRAGGAEAICWDDNQAARDRAVAEGFIVTDLSKSEAFQGVARLIVSPGIPHLYPEPNRIIAAAQAAGVPVDNDIGLFFASLGLGEWDQFDVTPKVVAVTGSNGKSTTSALIHHILSEAGGRHNSPATSAAASSTSIPPAKEGSWCWNLVPTRPS